METFKTRLEVQQFSAGWDAGRHGFGHPLRDMPADMVRDLKNPKKNRPATADPQALPPARAARLCLGTLAVEVQEAHEPFRRPVGVFLCQEQDAESGLVNVYVAVHFSVGRSCSGVTDPWSDERDRVRLNVRRLLYPMIMVAGGGDNQ